MWAKVYGWRRFHARTSGRMTAAGFAIPTVQGEKGFPDLVLLRPPRLIFAELKAGNGKLRPGQDEWLHDLKQMAAAPAYVQAGIEVYQWRPEQWSEILVVLSNALHPTKANPTPHTTAPLPMVR